MAEVKDKLRKFIREEVLFDEQRPIGDDQTLVGDVLDSLALMQLVEFIEEEFEFEVADEDVVPANFENLSNLERYVNAHAGG